MKLEPVAWMMIDKLGGDSIPRKNLPKEYNKDWWEFQPLYAIPEGYVVVPKAPIAEARELVAYVYGKQGYDNQNLYRAMDLIDQAMIAAGE